MCEPAVDSAVELRHLLREVLDRWELPPDVVDDAVLVTTELVTNAVVHAGTAFQVLVELQDGLLRVAVDDGCTRPPRRCAHRALGLRVVTRTAFRWGWCEHDTGKTVWADLLVVPGWNTGRG